MHLLGPLLHVVGVHFPHSQMSVLLSRPHTCWTSKLNYRSKISALLPLTHTGVTSLLTPRWFQNVLSWHHVSRFEIVTVPTPSNRAMQRLLCLGLNVCDVLSPIAEPIRPSIVHAFKPVSKVWEIAFNPWLLACLWLRRVKPLRCCSDLRPQLDHWHIKLLFLLCLSLRFHLWLSLRFLHLRIL